MEKQLVFDIEPDEIQIFMEEVNELLQSMETGTLSLEGEADAETLNSVFRAAHTLKALAGTVGHHAMANLTHTMETLFDAMRSNRMVATQPVIDELLVAVDVLRNLRDEIFTRRPSGVDATAIIERLKGINLEGKGPGPAKGEGAGWQLLPDQLTQLQALRDAGNLILKTSVETGPDAFAPAARLTQAAMVLQEFGEVVAQRPSMSDLAQSDGEKRVRLEAYLATKSDPPAVEKALTGISDITKCSVELFDIPEASARPPTVETSVPEKKPAEAGAPGVAAAAGDTGVDKTVRISIDRLDTLMNLIGELITDRNRLVQIDGTLYTQFGREGALVALAEMATHLGRVVDQLQEEVMRARMLPISSQFSKFPRIVRDVARIAGKKVNLVIEGETTELDRSLIEVIGDPLLHLLRNAVDHGIESPEQRIALGKPAAGTVRVTATHEEGHVIITISDDGKGIDPKQLKDAAVARGIITEDEAATMKDDEAIDLMFRPNVSTVKQVTSISGRGVGMDVVRNSVEKLSGSVLVDSTLGKGTTFRVTLPLTLAIVESMLVAIHGSVFAIPLTGIIDSLYLNDVTVNTIKSSPTIRWRETVLPLLDLRQMFAREGHPDRGETTSKAAIVTVGWGKQRAGLVVDGIIGKQGIVVKSMSTIIGEIPGILGSAILGDGRVALVVDVPSLIGAAYQMRRQEMLHE